MVAGAGLAVGAVFAIPASAQAQDFTVTTATDNVAGSLRSAITATEGNGTADRILFQAGVTGTMTLVGTELPQITKPLEIIGPGAANLTISGNNASRIFDINTPASTS